MKCVILLSLVALCYSLPTTTTGPPGKVVNISDDGTITITTADGKKVVISKAIGSADRFIDVSVEGPNVLPKKIQIDSQSTGKSVNIANGDSQYAAQYDYYADMKEREKRSPKVAAPAPANKTQGAILTEVFTDYQGVVDDKSYITLLAKVSDYVDSGKLDPSIYDVLGYLNEQRQQEQQEQLDSSTNPAKTYRQALWESWILNYLKSKSAQQNPDLSGTPQQPWASQPWTQQPAGSQWPAPSWNQPAGSQWPAPSWNQPAGQPTWNAQPWAAQQPAGQKWAGQPTWNAQPWAVQQPAGQPWAAQPAASQPWAAQPTTAKQWPAQQTVGQQWPAQQTVGQQWPAQQTVGQQWPAQQWSQPAGQASVPLQKTQGPSVVNTQFQQPAWQQPTPVQQTVPVNPDGTVYVPVYQPAPAGAQPGFPWMQFYWNRVLADQKKDATTTPAPDAKV